MRLMTIIEVAQYLRVSRSRAYELAASDGFPIIKIGKLLRVSDVALEEWLRQQVSYKSRA